MFEKLKSLYQHGKDDRISTSKQRQLINVKSTSEFDVEITLILDKKILSLMIIQCSRTVTLNDICSDLSSNSGF